MGEAVNIDWDSQPLGQMSDYALAQRLRSKAGIVNRERRKRGISPWAKPGGAGVSRGVDWDSQPFESVHYVELAKRLNVAPQSVIAAAKKRGRTWVASRLGPAPIKSVGPSTVQGYDFQWLHRRLVSIARKRLQQRGMESWAEDVAQDAAMLLYERMTAGYMTSAKSEQIAVLKAIQSMTKRAMARSQYTCEVETDRVHTEPDAPFRAIALWRLQDRWGTLTEREQAALFDKITGATADSNAVFTARIKLESPCTPP